MIRKIKDNLWEITFNSFGSCVYLLKIKNKNLLIDTSSLANRQELIKDLKSIGINPEEINILLLTHNHFDHVENIELFKKAEIYGSTKDFKCKLVKDIKKLKIPEIKVIETPGHTFGSLSFIYEDILFSGDTLFKNGIGRTDFPNSSSKDMENSLEKLEKIKYEFLCPGHID